MSYTLSILICSLSSRAAMLARLQDRLLLQCNALARPSNVAIDVEVDAGEMTVAEKRNMLIDRAVSDYVAFVDDDDGVSDDYISAIMRAVATGPDVVGIRGIITLPGDVRREFRHSIQYGAWYDSAGVYYRTPNHLNPVQVDIARAVRFRDSMSYGEDVDYAERLRPFLRTEINIDRPIYFYDSTHTAVSSSAYGRALEGGVR